MLHIPCPHCGLRNETEFHYGAEAGVAYPDPNTLTDSEWAKYWMWQVVQLMAEYDYT
jgi:heterotetrameric sarcosine oxidase delta subunit